MFRKLVVAIIALGVVGGVLAFGTPAQAQSVKAGIMTCNVAGGFGFIFGSSLQPMGGATRPLTGPFRRAALP